MEEDGESSKRNTPPHMDAEAVPHIAYAARIAHRKLGDIAEVLAHSVGLTVLDSHAP